VHGTLTNGAEDDMQQATNLARQMVTRWGMSEKLGPVSLAPPVNQFLPGIDGPGGSRPYSETTVTMIDAEVQRIVQDALARGVQLLQTHRRELDALAAALVEHETLEEQQILQVTGLRRAPRLESGPRTAATPAGGGRCVVDIEPAPTRA
jgi:cell division protease FtsH